MYVVTLSQIQSLESKIVVIISRCAIRIHLLLCFFDLHKFWVNFETMVHRSWVYNHCMLQFWYVEIISGGISFFCSSQWEISLKLNLFSWHGIFWQVQVHMQVAANFGPYQKMDKVTHSLVFNIYFWNMANFFPEYILNNTYI